MKKAQNSNIRYDLEIIADFIPMGAKCLDIGCGDGELLQYLRDKKNVDGRGIEVEQAQVTKALGRGLSVIQGDAQNDLEYYPDQSFDYAVLSQVIQATKNPDKILVEMLRVAKYAIVSLPNFAYYKNRAQLMFKGTMPVNELIPYQWYETPNIHFCSIRDFENLCRKLDLTIKEEVFLNGKKSFHKIFGQSFLANFFAEYGIFVIAKNNLAGNCEAVLSDNKNNIFNQKMVLQPV